MRDKKSLYSVDDIFMHFQLATQMIFSKRHNSTNAFLHKNIESKNAEKSIKRILKFMSWRNVYLAKGNFHHSITLRSTIV